MLSLLFIGAFCDRCQRFWWKELLRCGVNRITRRWQKQRCPLLGLTMASASSEFGVSSQYTLIVNIWHPRQHGFFHAVVLRHERMLDGANGGSTKQREIR